MAFTYAVFSFSQQGELVQLLALLKKSESLNEEQLAGLCILMDDFKTSLTSIQPSAKREGFATVPDVTWDDIGALQDIREELTMAILVGQPLFLKKLCVWKEVHPNKSPTFEEWVLKFFLNITSAKFLHFHDLIM